MKAENEDARGTTPEAENWRRLLREHDPADRGIDPRRAVEIRHAAIEVARASKPSGSPWRWRLAAGALAIVLFAGGISDHGQPTTQPDPVLEAPGSERRQVQFATPGGTRIIWEINPDFSLREMVP